MNVLSMEAKIFTIRCGICQIFQIQYVYYIVIVTDAIYTTKHIFNMFIHPYQLQSIAIFSNLKNFFNKNNNNHILF